MCNCISGYQNISELNLFPPVKININLMINITRNEKALSFGYLFLEKYSFKYPSSNQDFFFIHNCYKTRQYET